jgi:hypothetical protein
MRQEIFGCALGGIQILLLPGVAVAKGKAVDRPALATRPGRALRIALAAVLADDGTGVYSAAIEGISAKDINKTIYVAAGYTNNGVSYCTGVLPYSIGAYCVSKAGVADNIQPLAKATAVYGYYAQQMFAGN